MIELWINSKIVYDHVPLHEAYVEEAVASGDKAEYYSGVIGGPIYTLIDSGKVPSLKESTGLGDIVNKRKNGRTSDDETIIFVACGMGVYDVAWGFDLYHKALAKGIGQKLVLWDEPSLK